MCCKHDAELEQHDAAAKHDAELPEPGLVQATLAQLLPLMFLRALGQDSE